MPVHMANNFCNTFSLNKWWFFSQNLSMTIFGYKIEHWLKLLIVRLVYNPCTSIYLKKNLSSHYLKFQKQMRGKKLIILWYCISCVMSSINWSLSLILLIVWLTGESGITQLVNSWSPILHYIHQLLKNIFTYQSIVYI